MKSGKIHYAWVMLGACCLMTFGIGGCLYNSVGVFMPSVCEDMGWTTAQFSLYFNIRQIVLVLLLPASGILIPKSNPRILFTGACLVGVASLVLLAAADELWQLYVSGAMCGVTSAFTVITGTAIVLKRWFHKKYGMALGICTAFTGIGGMIMNLAGAWLMEIFSWRSAVLALAGVSAVFSLPVTLLLMRKNPESVGLQPYGYDPSEEAVAAADGGAGRVSRLLFVLVMLDAMLITIPQAFSSHCTQFGVSIGKTAMEAAGLSSAFLLGNTTGKITLGWLSEKMSNQRAISLGVSAVIGGFLLMAVSGAFPILLAGSFLGGVSMSVTAIAVPLLVGDFFPRRQYDMILSCGNMSTMFVAGFVTTAYGLGYDRLGSYRPSLFLTAGVYCLLLLMIGLSYAKAGKPKA